MRNHGLEGGSNHRACVCMHGLGGAGSGLRCVILPRPCLFKQDD